jgi:hypothetical protein
MPNNNKVTSTGNLMALYKFHWKCACSSTKNSECIFLEQHRGENFLQFKEKVTFKWIQFLIQP